MDQRGDNRLDDWRYRNDDSTLRRDLWFTLNSQRDPSATPIPSHAAGMRWKGWLLKTVSESRTQQNQRVSSMSDVLSAPAAGEVSSRLRNTESHGKIQNTDVQSIPCTETTKQSNNPCLLTQNRKSLPLLSRQTQTDE